MRRYVISYFLALLAMVGVVGGLNWIYDPLQIFRRAEFYAPVFSDVQRLQNLGLLLNFEYDTAIVGTSTSDGLRPSYLRPKYNAVKVSIDGGTLPDIKTVIGFASSIGKTKNIIWGIDTFLFSNPMQGRAWPKYAQEIVANDPRGRWRYVLNFDTTLRTFKIILSRYGVTQRELVELDDLNVYSSANASAEKLLSLSKQLTHPNRMKKEDEWLDAYNAAGLSGERFEQTLIAVLTPIIAHPDVSFIIYFTPSSILRYQTIDKDTFAYEFKVKQFLINQLLKLPNVSLIDFQCDADIIMAYGEYLDLVHYSDKVNKDIASVILEGTRKVNEDNVSYCLELMPKYVVSMPN